MDKYQAFGQAVKNAVDFFESFDSDEPVRVISHLDTDGICASSIIIRMLLDRNMKHSVSIIPQLNTEIIQSYQREPYKNYIFTDLGSGQAVHIKRLMNEKRVLILDHHVPVKCDLGDLDIFHLNPHLYDIDGSQEISGAGVVYMFAKELSDKNKKLSHLAVLGAIGDSQEKKGFLKLNNEILKEAVENGTLEIERGIRFFGASSRPLIKLLEYSTDPFIPGVTGSEQGALDFMNQIGIKPKINNKWKMLNQLCDDENKKLCQAIIERRINEKNPEDIVGNIYLIPAEANDSPTHDLKEFSTLLNACGRMGKSSLGIGTCLGDTPSKTRAIHNLYEYRKEIMKSLKWYGANQDSKEIIKKEKYIIIQAGDNIPATIIGTVASILSRSKELEKGTMILALAQSDDLTTKTSLRIVGMNPEIDLRKIIQEITNSVGGESGGHGNASGSIIKTENEDKFISSAKIILNKYCLEECVSEQQ
ncbi:DHH family phosphoesterase [Candidatus Woesearchaeota archaeon]|nr:DHH family phosphoesterase [Candidatus Woesearchaeota archaeon]